MLPSTSPRKRSPARASAAGSALLEAVITFIAEHVRRVHVIFVVAILLSFVLGRVSGPRCDVSRDSGLVSLSSVTSSSSSLSSSSSSSVLSLSSKGIGSSSSSVCNPGAGKALSADEVDLFGSLSVSGHASTSSSAPVCAGMESNPCVSRLRSRLRECEHDLHDGPYEGAAVFPATPGVCVSAGTDPLAPVGMDYGEILVHVPFDDKSRKTAASIIASNGAIVRSATKPPFYLSVFPPFDDPFVSGAIWDSLYERSATELFVRLVRRDSPGGGFNPMKKPMQQATSGQSTTASADSSGAGEVGDEYALGDFDAATPRLFVDVGSGVGWFTILAHTLGLRAVTFEPQEAIAEHLITSMALAGIDPRAEAGSVHGPAVRLHIAAVGQRGTHAWAGPGVLAMGPGIIVGGKSTGGDKYEYLRALNARAGKVLKTGVPRSAISQEDVFPAMAEKVSEGQNPVRRLTLDSMVREEIYMLRIGTSRFAASVIKSAGRLMRHGLVANILFRYRRKYSPGTGSGVEILRFLAQHNMTRVMVVSEDWVRGLQMGKAKVVPTTAAGAIEFDKSEFAGTVPLLWAVRDEGIAVRQREWMMDSKKKDTANKQKQKIKKKKAIKGKSTKSKNNKIDSFKNSKNSTKNNNNNDKNKSMDKNKNAKDGVGNENDVKGLGSQIKSDNSKSGKRKNTQANGSGNDDEEDGDHEEEDEYEGIDDGDDDEARRALEAIGLSNARVQDIWGQRSGGSILAKKDMGFY